MMYISKLGTHGFFDQLIDGFFLVKAFSGCFVSLTPQGVVAVGFALDGGIRASLKFGKQATVTSFGLRPTDPNATT